MVSISVDPRIRPGTGLTLKGCWTRDYRTLDIDYWLFKKKKTNNQYPG
jgi:hypothetical protein